MSVLPPSKEERDQNLDDLAKAVKEYADEEVKRLDNEVKFMKKVLEGRGVSNAAAKNLDELTKIVAVEINAFLSG